MNFLINLTKNLTPLHNHKDYELIIVTKGNGIFHSHGKGTPICSGTIIIVPPGTMHGSTFEESLERIFIRGEFHQFFNLVSPTIVADNSAQEGLILAQTIYANRYSNTEYLSALCNAFAYYLLQRLKIDNEIHQVIEEIINQMAVNFHNPDFSVTDLLKKSGYAEDYIRAQFKKLTKSTPIEFLTKIRISHACYLIEQYHNSLSLSEIAGRCGYTDYAYFSRKFKQVSGVSPKEYMRT